MGRKNVAVLGAGAVGMSTALCIQDNIPDCNVTVIADKFNSDTTSDGAAGMFRPTLARTPAKCEAAMKRWVKNSFERFDHLWRTEPPIETGIIRLGGYQMMDTKLPIPVSQSAVYHFRELNEEEIKNLPGKKRFRYAWYFDSLMVECSRYLPWMMKRFLANGGRVIGQTFQSITDIPSNFDAVVNCLGFGSKTVFQDKSMFAVRGHTIRVEAPWIKNFYVIGEGDNYIYPGQDSVVLGGTRETGEEALEYKQSTTYDKILHKCSEILPGLKNSPVQKKWVGLRPHRDHIRIESEKIEIGGKTVQVVHNYGHGANGVCLSWGTAIEAVRILQDVLSSSISKL